MTPEEQKNERAKYINHRLSRNLFSRNFLKMIISQVIAVALFVPVYYYLIRPLSINLTANIIEKHNAALFNKNPNFIAPSTQHEELTLKQKTAVNSRLIKPIDSVVFDLMALLSISLPLLFVLIVSLWHDIHNYEEE